MLLRYDIKVYCQVPTRLTLKFHFTVDAWQKISSLYITPKTALNHKLQHDLVATSILKHLHDQTVHEMKNITICKSTYEHRNIMPAEYLKSKSSMR